MMRRSLLAAAPALFLSRVGHAFYMLSGGSPIQQINTRDSINGSVTNAYGTWRFAQGITPKASGGSSCLGLPTGPFGPQCYVSLNGKVINDIGLFGPGSVRTGASLIAIIGGDAFFLTSESDQQWFQYSNYDGVRYGAGSPCITTVSGLPLPTPGPYPPLSSDGTMLTSTPGTVVSVDGVWSNGAGGSSWFPTLNGIPYSAADPTHTFNQLKVACNGNMFAFDVTQGQWSAFLSGQHYFTGASAPTGPIPVAVTVTPVPGLVTGGPNDPCAHITTATASGTSIANVAVTMSDASSFAGTLSLSAPSWVQLVGTQIQTLGTPTSGAVNITVSASQGGMAACAPGAATIEVIVS